MGFAMIQRLIFIKVRFKKKLTKKLLNTINIAKTLLKNKWT